MTCAGMHSLPQFCWALMQIACNNWMLSVHCFLLTDLCSLTHWPRWTPVFWNSSVLATSSSPPNAKQLSEESFLFSLERWLRYNTPPLCNKHPCQDPSCTCLFDSLYLLPQFGSIKMTGENIMQFQHCPYASMSYHGRWHSAMSGQCQANWVACLVQTTEWLLGSSHCLPLFSSTEQHLTKKARSEASSSREMIGFSQYPRQPPYQNQIEKTWLVTEGGGGRGWGAYKICCKDWTTKQRMHDLAPPKHTKANTFLKNDSRVRQETKNSI